MIAMYPMLFKYFVSVYVSCDTRIYIYTVVKACNVWIWTIFYLLSIICYNHDDIIVFSVYNPPPDSFWSVEE